MHCNFNVGETQLMASDGMCSGSPKFAGVSLSITAKDAAEAERLFAALSEGGQVQLPMHETFFAERFGMVADKFGVSWMLIAGKERVVVGVAGTLACIARPLFATFSFLLVQKKES